MKNSQSFLKLISLTVFASFAVQQVALAVPLAQPLNFHKNNTIPISFSIPDSIASVDALYRGSDDKTIILMQDAHTNETGQMNLSKAINSIVQAEDIETVYTEAAQGDQSLTSMKTEFGSDVLKQVGMKYLRQGVLQGTAYANMTGGQDFVIWGVENKDLYWKSIEDYQVVAKKRQTILNYLTQVNNVVSTLKPRVFNEDLLTFNRIHLRYLKEEITIAQYIQILLKQTPDTKNFPHLQKLSTLMKLEKSIDFKTANAELRQLCTEYKSLCNSSTVKPLTSKDVSIQLDYFYSLRENSIERGIDIRKDYVSLNQYMEYLEKARHIDAKAILEEQKDLELAIYENLAVSVDEKLLVQYENSIRQLKALFEFQLTPQEFDAYLNNKQSFRIEVITGFLNRMIMDLEKHYDLTLYLEDDFNSWVEDAEDFYQLTYSRDLAFVNNMLERMEAKGESKAVLVTGGFHNPNVKALLESRGISYVSLIPKVLQETNHKRYERILLSQLSYKKEAIRLADAKDRAYRVIEESKNAALHVYPTDYVMPSGLSLATQMRFEASEISGKDFSAAPSVRMANAEEFYEASATYGLDRVITEAGKTYEAGERKVIEELVRWLWANQSEWIQGWEEGEAGLNQKVNAIRELYEYFKKSPEATVNNKTYPGKGPEGVHERWLDMIEPWLNKTDDFAPWNGKTVILPEGNRHVFGLEAEASEDTDSTKNYNLEDLANMQELGLSAAHRLAFVLVAGGSGKRLEYEALKLGMPTSWVNMISNLQRYAEGIKLLEAQAIATGAVNPESFEGIPMYLMTSADNHEDIEAYLEEQGYFGLLPKQFILFQQSEAIVRDVKGKFSLKSADNPYGLQWGSPGHGEIHKLMHQLGYAKDLKDRYVVFAQDTNPQIMNSVLAATAVLLDGKTAVAHVTTQKTVGEQAGVLADFVNQETNQKDLRGMVEYTQLDPADDKPAEEGSTISIWSANTNGFIWNGAVYAELLNQTQGFLPELVKLKDITDKGRLETQMQDLTYMLALKPEALKQLPQVTEIHPNTLRDSIADVYFAGDAGKTYVFSPVKNSLINGAKKFAGQVPPDVQPVSEHDTAKANRHILSQLGIQVDVNGDTRTIPIVVHDELHLEALNEDAIKANKEEDVLSLNEDSVLIDSQGRQLVTEFEMGPIILPGSPLYIDLNLLNAHFPQPEKVEIRGDSVLSVNGNPDSWRVDGLSLHGFVLDVDIPEGTQVIFDGLDLKGEGYQYIGLTYDETKSQDIPSEFRIRGFTLNEQAMESSRKISKSIQEGINFNQGGTVRVSGTTNNLIFTPVRDAEPLYEARMSSDFNGYGLKMYEVQALLSAAYNHSQSSEDAKDRWTLEEYGIISNNVIDWLQANNNVVPLTHKKVIAESLQANAYQALKGGFFNKLGILTPGTAGVRNTMENLDKGMVGPNYVGVVTMRQYADMYRAHIEDLREQGDFSENAYAVIMGEVRPNTETFGNILAQGLAAAGVNVIRHLKPKSSPATTPLISHTAQYFEKQIGEKPFAVLAITASHNGLTDSGVKFFDTNGTQLLPDAVEKLLSYKAEKVSDIKAFPDLDLLENEHGIGDQSEAAQAAYILHKFYNRDERRDDIDRLHSGEFGLIRDLNDEEYPGLLTDYNYAIESSIADDFGDVKKIIKTATEGGMRFVFTPVNGATYYETRYFLTEHLGLEEGKDFLIPEDESVLPQNDANHPAWGYDNFDPAREDMLAKTKKFADENGINIIMARDLDGDRFVITIKKDGEWKTFDGNQNAILMLDEKLSDLSDDERAEFVMMRSHVTSPLLDPIAKSNGVLEKNIGVVPVGFKYPGTVIARKLGQWLRGFFAAEDSFGVSNGVDPEKDSLTGLVNMLLNAAKRFNDGLDLVQYLKSIYEKYGFTGDVTTKIQIPGAAKPEWEANKEKSLEVLGNLEAGDMIYDLYEVIKIDHEFESALYNPGEILTDGYRFLLEDIDTGERIFAVIRASGTEPVFKHYFFWAEPQKPAEGENIDDVINRTNAYLEDNFKPAMQFFFEETWTAPRMAWHDTIEVGDLKLYVPGSSGWVSDLTKGIDLPTVEFRTDRSNAYTPEQSHENLEIRLVSNQRELEDGGLVYEIRHVVHYQGDDDSFDEDPKDFTHSQKVALDNAYVDIHDLPQTIDVDIKWDDSVANDAMKEHLRELIGRNITFAHKKSIRIRSDVAPSARLAEVLIASDVQSRDFARGSVQATKFFANQRPVKGRDQLALTIEKAPKLQVGLFNVRGGGDGLSLTVATHNQVQVLSYLNEGERQEAARSVLNPLNVAKTDPRFELTGQLAAEGRWVAEHTQNIPRLEMPFFLDLSASRLAKNKEGNRQFEAKVALLLRGIQSVERYADGEFFIQTGELNEPRMALVESTLGVLSNVHLNTEYTGPQVASNLVTVQNAADFRGFKPHAINLAIPLDDPRTVMGWRKYFALVVLGAVDILRSTGKSTLNEAFGGAERFSDTFVQDLNSFIFHPFASGRHAFQFTNNELESFTPQELLGHRMRRLLHAKLNQAVQMAAYVMQYLRTSA